MQGMWYALYRRYKLYYSEKFHGGKEMTYKSNEVILWMDKCDPLRLTPNTIMLCTRNMFLLENMRDMYPDEYHEIIRQSGSAGIVTL